MKFPSTTRNCRILRNRDEREWLCFNTSTSAFTPSSLIELSPSSRFFMKTLLASPFASISAPLASRLFHSTPYSSSNLNPATPSWSYSPILPPTPSPTPSLCCSGLPSMREYVVSASAKFDCTSRLKLCCSLFHRLCNSLLPLCNGIHKKRIFIRLLLLIVAAKLLTFLLLIVFSPKQ